MHHHVGYALAGAGLSCRLCIPDRHQQKTRLLRAAFLAVATGMAALLLCFGVASAARERGSFAEIVLPAYEKVTFTQITLRDYDHTPDYRLLENEAFERLFSYLCALPLRAEPPRRPAPVPAAGLTLTLHGNGIYPYPGGTRYTKETLRIHFPTDTTLLIRGETRDGRKWQKSYLVENRVDMEMLYSLLSEK